MTEPLITQTTVTYSSLRKINLGNYESQDEHLSVTYTSPHDADDALYWKAVEFVETKLDEREKEVRKTSLNTISKNRAAEDEPAKKEKPSEEVEDKPMKKQKPAKEEKPVEVDDEDDFDDEDEDGAITLETIKAALRDYSNKYKKSAAKKIIESITGSDKMASIKEKHYSELMIALEKSPE